ncbi:toxin [Nocardia sp. NPDC052278]|uniref:Tc toxin subunit A-related protein n=1 Tax=unclassified Nocardia TaxID=2637762 RepID=UPI0036B9589E
MSNNKLTFGNHSYKELKLAGWYETTYRPDTEYTYTFENLFHPYVGRLIKQLNRKSLPGLLDASFHQDLEADFFDDFYDALSSSQQVSFGTFPKKNIDLADGGPYAVYNWELLFHLPFGIAVHLSKSQRFAEAMRWFHYVFDPTSTDPAVPPPARYWRFLRFRQETDHRQIDELLQLLSKPDTECTQPERDEKVRILEGYKTIKDNPFQPHRVARTRVIAYQYAVIMRYLDNLIAWGDSLFAQDTVESINEATQRYVLAANVLGSRPMRVPPRGEVKPHSYKQLRERSAAGIDEFANALVELEGRFPFNTAPPPTGTSSEPHSPLLGFGRALYFCIPRNEKLLGYWDTVEDRLSKIRNCMNIHGVVRSLALFDPPLDPGMLVKAAAGGIDTASIIAGLNQPIGPMRAQLLLQQAQELCAEVKSLGQALLSAIEKREGEQLTLLRQGHELRVQELTQGIRFLQWKQAEEATESLLRTRASALERYDYYLRAIGVSRDPNAVPDTFALGHRTPVTEETFDEVFAALVGQFDQEVPRRPYATLKLAGQTSPAVGSGAIGTGPLFLNDNEAVDLNVFGPAAHSIREDTMKADMVAAVLALIPDMGVDLHFWGMGGHANIFGGSSLSTAARFYGNIHNLEATGEEFKGSTATKTASFERRADDWIHQGNVAARELAQIGRQLIGSLIAEQTAHQEYLSVKEQIDQTREVDRFMREKIAGEALYGWMQGELSRLYYEHYRFALDVARKAERTAKHELMRPEFDKAQFVKFNYWDAGRRGLLSGEALALDLKRLTLAYAENNQREFELTRHVSLRQLDPVGLLTLKMTGSCTFSVPESLFDMDCVHYLRRLRSVALSIPAVVGPYTPLHATLTLLGSSVRTKPLLKDGAYARQRPDDDRFVDYLGTVQQIVTSGGTNDAGMFEPNLRDERPLPFEGAGAVSTWRIDLPKNSSISDIVLHFRFTARQVSDALAKQANLELKDQLEHAASSGLALMFSLRHDFPTEWTDFATSGGNLTLTLRKDYLPFFVQSRDVAIDAIDLATKRGDTLGRRAALTTAGDSATLTALSDGLNGPNASTTLTLPPDAQILRSDAPSPVYLIVRYHLA